MKKTDNYSARVEIENIVGDPSKVDENSLFTLLTRLAIRKGRIFDMGIILASRDDKYSGHVELAEKRLPSQSTSIQSPSQFPYDRIELRSWRDKLGVQSFGRMKGAFATMMLIFLQIMRNISWGGWLPWLLGFAWKRLYKSWILSRNFRLRSWQKLGRGLDTEFTFNIAIAIIAICILFLVGRVGLD